MEVFQKITLSQTNCFLLKATDGYLLIDCGRAGSEQAFLSELGRMGIDPLSIRYLLLTHHHSDHCGLLHFLLSVNPKTRIIMSEACAAYLETGLHFKPEAERYSSKTLNFAIWLYGLIGGKLTDTFQPYFIRAGDVILPGQDGALPDFTGIRGRLLYTPGHTEDSISLVVGDDAFVGDAARNLLGFTGAPYKPILYYDQKACYKSWRKLLAAGARTIHPAHGKSFPACRLKRYM